MPDKDSLLRLEDLVNNPTPRVPVCLCLDTSFSMTRVVEGKVEKTGRTVVKDGVEWDVVTGGISAITKLNEGVKAFYKALSEDEVAKYAAEVCIVTFGGEAPSLVMDFANISRQPVWPTLEADGETPMGEAVNLALDCLEKRKKEYQDKGVDYYQPWLVLMTDGAPTGSDPEQLENAIERTRELIANKKLTIFPIGIGNKADMDTLERFSPTRKPLHIKETKFPIFFEWLSQSVSITSKSMPGERIQLDESKIKDWAEL